MNNNADNNCLYIYINTIIQIYEHKKYVGRNQINEEVNNYLKITNVLKSNKIQTNIITIILTIFKIFIFYNKW